MHKETVHIDVGDGAAIPTKKDRGLFNAWWIALLGALTVLTLLMVLRPDPYYKIFTFMLPEVEIQVTPHIEEHYQAPEVQDQAGEQAGAPTGVPEDAPTASSGAGVASVSDRHGTGDAVHQAGEVLGIRDTGADQGVEEAVQVPEQRPGFTHVSYSWDRNWRFQPGGILITFEVTVLSIIGALILGLLTGLGRITRIRPLNLIASTYVEVVRGIPLLVQLFYIYFALGQIFRNLPESNQLFIFLKNMPPLVAAVIAMSFCYGAYMGEVFRAGIQSIDKGQTEAARSLGFSGGQTMRLVILPQAWRTILPPVGNEFIALLKDSSLVSILAISDILRNGREFASRTFLYFEAYTIVALVYLIITLILSKGVSRMENRLSHYVKD